MGGKRKSKKRVVTKKKDVVPSSFKCPYCAHEGSCEVKMDRGAETGSVTCRVCGETYQSRITTLSDPVDVYCEWLDALEETKIGGGAGGGGGGGTAAGAAE